MKLTGMLLGRMVLTGSIFLTALVASPAFAGLGGDSTSVQADVERMKGALRITSAAGVTVHEITTADGTVIREYLTPGDKVFAVTWRGRGIPDLRQMLGGYYAQYEQAAAERAATGGPHPGRRRQLSIERPELVMRVSGHMRAFYGRAWAPALLPQNFSVKDIE